MKKVILLFVVLIAGVQMSNAQKQNHNGDYGSLAIDTRNGDIYGWAINYPSQKEADKRALEECKKRGSNGHIVLNFKGGCAAYVVERGNPDLYGWGTANTRTEAVNIATKEARAQGGKDLVVRVWGCNGTKLSLSKEIKPGIKGVYGFYFTKSDKNKQCFISGVYYQPGVAQNKGNQWVWTADAKRKMTPQAKKFMYQVIDDLYSNVGKLSTETKDKFITNLDWKGINEIDITNATINLSNTERREKLENATNSIRKSFKNKGYEVFVFDISM